ncbi:MAG: hypothetical protein L0I76_19520 [Pseudonocardia sp.]|nr:hypothetical protein [Pseudonocardia sp.]
MSLVQAGQDARPPGPEMGREAAQHRYTGGDQGVVPLDRPLVILRGEVELARVDLPRQSDVGEPDVDAGQELPVRSVEPGIAHRLRPVHAPQQVGHGGLGRGTRAIRDLGEHLSRHGASALRPGGELHGEGGDVAPPGLDGLGQRGPHLIARAQPAAGIEDGARGRGERPPPGNCAR